MTPLVEQRIGDGRHRRVEALGLPPAAAHHVREHVQPRSGARSERDREFFDVVRRQRAHRDFSDEPVSDADVARLLEAATYAPSAENRQPWEFIVVRDADRARRHRRPHPAGMGDARPRVLGGPARRRSCSPTSTAARPAASRAAPVTIVVVRRHRTRARRRPCRRRSSPPCRTCLLAATALGLGTALDDDHRRFPRRARARCSSCRSTSCRSRWCRSGTRRASSDRRAASRSRRTRTATITERPGVPDALLGRLFAHDEDGARGVAHDVLARGAEEQA